VIWAVRGEIEDKVAFFADEGYIVRVGAGFD
jgi:hypothetical protein